jgi:hypothetical protein
MNNNLAIIELTIEEQWMRIMRNYLRNMIDPFNIAELNFTYHLLELWYNIA